MWLHYCKACECIFVTVRIATQQVQLTYSQHLNSQTPIPSPSHPTIPPSRQRYILKTLQKRDPAESSRRSNEEPQWPAWNTARRSEASARGTTITSCQRTPPPPFAEWRAREHARQRARLGQGSPESYIVQSYVLSSFLLSLFTEM